MNVDKTEFCRDIIAFFFVQVGVLLVTIDGVVHLWEAFLIIFIYVLYIGIAVYIGRKSSAVITVNLSQSVEEALLNPDDRPSSQADEDDEDDDDLEGLTLGDDKIGNAQIIAEYPLTVVRWLSIPGGDGKWSEGRRKFFIASPTFVLLLLFLCLNIQGDNIGSTGLNVCLLAPVIGVPVSILLMKLVPVGSKKPVVADIFGFLCSVMWLYLIANECVAVLQTMGLIFDVPSSILAITVLAIGNSIGDLVADTAVAKRYPAAAVAACLGAPLLSTLLGLGKVFIVKL